MSSPVSSSPLQSSSEIPSAILRHLFRLSFRDSNLLMVLAAEAGVWRSAALLCDDDLLLSCGNSCAAMPWLPDAPLNSNRFILLIQIAQTINFLPGACFVFSLEEVKCGNVWPLLLLISIKLFVPQRFCGSMCRFTAMGDNPFPYLANDGVSQGFFPPCRLLWDCLPANVLHACVFNN